MFIHLLLVVVLQKLKIHYLLREFKDEIKRIWGKIMSVQLVFMKSIAKTLYVDRKT